MGTTTKAERPAQDTAARRATRQSTGGDIGVNEVRLVGRVSAEPQERELPSGDRVVSLRVVVPRATPVSPTVDVIDVGCWAAAARRAALRLGPGDEVELTGALRRRFFRGAGGVQSRYEVEAALVRRAGRPQAGP